MDAVLLKSLEEMLAELIEKVNKLSGMAYADPNYDKLEDEIHDLEDDFNDEFGDAISDVLEGIHDDICPDTDVQIATAYIAKKYIITGTDESGKPVYDVQFPDGVPVTLDKAPKKEARLVFLPNPLRLVLMLNKQRKVVWEA